MSSRHRSSRSRRSRSSNRSRSRSRSYSRSRSRSRSYSPARSPHSHRKNRRERSPSPRKWVNDKFEAEVDDSSGQKKSFTQIAFDYQKVEQRKRSRSPENQWNYRRSQPRVQRESLPHPSSRSRSSSGKGLDEFGRVMRYSNRGDSRVSDSDDEDDLERRLKRRKFGATGPKSWRKDIEDDDSDDDYLKRKREQASQELKQKPDSDVLLTTLSNILIDNRRKDEVQRSAAENLFFKLEKQRVSSVKDVKVRLMSEYLSSDDLRARDRLMQQQLDREEYEKEIDNAESYESFKARKMQERWNEKRRKTEDDRKHIAAGKIMKEIDEQKQAKKFPLQTFTKAADTTASDEPNQSNEPDEDKGSRYVGVNADPSGESDEPILPEWTPVESEAQPTESADAVDVDLTEASQKKYPKFFKPDTSSDPQSQVPAGSVKSQQTSAPVSDSGWALPKFLQKTGTQPNPDTDESTSNVPKSKWPIPKFLQKTGMESLKRAGGEEAAKVDTKKKDTAKSKWQIPKFLQPSRSSSESNPADAEENKPSEIHQNSDHTNSLDTNIQTSRPQPPQRSALPASNQSQRGLGAPSLPPPFGAAAPPFPYPYPYPFPYPCPQMFPYPQMPQPPQPQPHQPPTAGNSSDTANSMSGQYDPSKA